MSFALASIIYKSIVGMRNWAWWLLPIIPTFLEAEVRGSQVQVQLGQHNKALSEDKKGRKKGREEGKERGRKKVGRGSGDIA